MPDRTCSVEGCEKPHFGRGLCQGHYMRLYRTGSVGSAPLVEKHPGALCSIGGCDAPAAARGWCQTHYTRWRRQGDPLTVGTPRIRTGADHPNWAGDDATYSGLHIRLRRSLGPASAHPCAFGCGAIARHWSYDHVDPGERVSSTGVPYSTDPAHYRPLCVPCHKRFDLDHLDRGRAG